VFLAILVSAASAEIAINLAGPGTGTVTSNPDGINCSNVSGGAPGPACSAEFENFAVEQLSAVPGSGFFLSAWSADDPFGSLPFLSPSCNTGSANPCKVANQTGATVHVTATFDCSSFAVTTGDSSAGSDFSLRTLEGTVDADGCGVSESYFEYGPTTEYGFTTPTVPSASELSGDSGSAAVAAKTEPLEPETTYHYRLVVSNAGGTVRGEDHTFATGPAPSDGCPNAARRAEQGIRTILLPDCMALEMVSPPQKVGQAARFPNVSADGSRVSFVSLAALGENPPGLSQGGATYVASRGESGWASKMTLPDVSPHFTAQWEFNSEIRPSFTPDFSRWLGLASTVKQQQSGVGQAYEAGLEGFFRPLSEPFGPLSGEVVDVLNKSKFQGASADHSHLYFTPGGRATYFPDDPDPRLHSTDSGAERANVYLARSGLSGQPAALELLQRDRAGKVWGGNCGARLGGIGSVLNFDLPAPNGERNQGAISVDGSRTYFSARAAQPESGNCEASNKLRILERLESPSGPVIGPLFSSECSRPPTEPCSSANGDDLYQGASLDQSKVYFTTNRQLASTDIDGSGAECSVLFAVSGCDLYLYDRTRPAGERLVQVSGGEELGAGVHEAGNEADVYNGITAISADGSHVYFVATSVLTDNSNPEGDSAQPGEPNLYMWDEKAWEEEGEEGGLAFVGTLARLLSLSDPGDAIALSDAGDGLWGGQGTWRNNAYPVPVTGNDNEGNEVGGDGHILAFESRAELTPNDRDGRHLDVYRYDGEAETLRCLSCAPGSSVSEPDEAPVDVESHGEPFPSGTDFAESHRWASEDGEEVSFISPENLLPGDVDGAEDFYLWRQGALARLPGKPYLGFGTIVSFAGPHLSHDGSTVAFTTATPLLPQDGDKSADVYVARENGGFPNPPVPNPCEPGNPSKECQHSEPPPAVLKAASEELGPGNSKRPPCPKGRVRRKGRCVAKHARKHHAGHRHRTRHADANRRAAQ
jgi:hypothetical protein